MRRRRKITKNADTETVVTCVAGFGKIREEVWIDENHEVSRYNLAFINHFLFQRDNGRVLGYDMAHGHHHRHFIGSVEEIEFPGYEALLERFIAELSELRKKRSI